MPDHMLTQKILQELLHYDPDTGIFTWQARDRAWFNSDRIWKSCNSRISGTAAGTVFTDGSGKKYTRIIVIGGKHLAHRLAWLYVHGVPPEEIDHINGNGEDNRICNLRSVDRLENCRNLRLHSNNTSGICGVTWDKWHNKWKSQIAIDGKHIHIGYFHDINDAVKARKDANIKYGFFKNHGSKRPL